MLCFSVDVRSEGLKNVNRRGFCVFVLCFERESSGVCLMCLVFLFLIIAVCTLFYLKDPR